MLSLLALLLQSTNSDAEGAFLGGGVRDVEYEATCSPSAASALFFSARCFWKLVCGSAYIFLFIFIFYFSPFLRESAHLLRRLLLGANLWQSSCLLLLLLLLSNRQTDSCCRGGKSSKVMPLRIAFANLVNFDTGCSRANRFCLKEWKALSKVSCVTLPLSLILLDFCNDFQA